MVIGPSQAQFSLSLSQSFFAQKKEVPLLLEFMSEKGPPLPKFGEWDVNDPASAEGFTVIFNKARDEKKTGGTPESPGNVDPNVKPTRPVVEPCKPQTKKWFCFMHEPTTQS